jgi:DNA-binding transcriptional ArsR family regulator
MHVRDAKTRDILSCLGDPSRFELVLRLLERERCVSELANAVGLSQSCTTRHLQALSRLGVVHGKRDGKRVMFRLCLERPAVSELLDWATRSSPAGGAHVHVDGVGRRVGRPVEQSRPTRHRRRSPVAKPVAPTAGVAKTPARATMQPLAVAEPPAVIAQPPAAATEPPPGSGMAPTATPDEEDRRPRAARRFQELEDFLL